MDISAIFKAVLAPDQESGLERFEGLRPGDQLTGKIVRVETDGRLLIDLGRFRALAQTNIQTQAGQTLKLTVEKLGTPLHLRLASATSSQAAKALPQIALSSLLTSAERQKVVNAIQRLLTSLPDQAKMPALPLIQRLGQATQEAPAAQPRGEAAQKIPAAQPQGEVARKPRAVQPRSEGVRTPAQISLRKPSLDQPRGEVAQKSPQGQLQGETAKAPLSRFQSETMQTPPTPQLRSETGAMPSAPSTSGAMAPSLASNTMAGAGKTQMPIHHALVQLGGVLVEFSSQASVQQWVDALRLQLSESGHLFETRLADLADPSLPSNTQADADGLQRAVGRDLKPNLMILRELFAETNANALSESGARPKDIAILRQIVDRLLSHIEQQQERAVQRAGDQDLYQVFAHLLPVKEQAQPVRLKVYYPRKGRGEKHDLQHRIALLLDMDRLGPVRADVATAGNTLSIRFFVRDREVQAIFDQHVPEVETVLSEPFEWVDIITEVSKEKIAQFGREDRMGPSVGRIDVRA